MKLRRHGEGFVAVGGPDGPMYILMVRRETESDPFALVLCGTLGSVDEDGSGLRWSARYNAMRGRWAVVQIWQAVSGTWSDPDLLLESYLPDGSCVVHRELNPPATAG